jgi:glucose/arabinose dehydrogenase
VGTLRAAGIVGGSVALAVAGVAAAGAGALSHGAGALSHGAGALSHGAGALSHGAGKAPAAAGTRAEAGGATGSGFASVVVSVPAGNGRAPFDVAHRLTVPAGWKVEVWARVGGARFETWSPQGDLLVSVPTAGEVLELRPRPQPSAVPQSRVLLAGLNDPQGLAFDDLDGKEVLYVAEADEIDRYAWSAAGPGKRTVVVAHLPWQAPKGSDDHPLKSLAIAKDHTLYFDIGSSANADTADLGTYPPRASVLAVRPDGTGLRVLAIGVRNAEGLAVAPDGDLWAAVNEADNVAYPFHRPYAGYGDAFGKVIQSYVDVNPPDALARVGRLRNLGWPYCNPTAQVTPGAASSALRFSDDKFVPDATLNPLGRSLDCAKLKPIERGLPAHSAPLGLTFLEGSSLPAPWDGGAALAVHGSWDRQPPLAPAVLWLAWDAHTHLLGAPVEIISGFQLTGGSRWGRPVDAMPGPDGSLYVTDNLAGAVYRVTT